MLDRLKQAKQAIESALGPFPEVVVVLGSGMAGVLGELEVEREMPFSDIPYVPRLGVRGHVGKVRVGRLGTARVAVAQGRVHFYEGHPMETVVLPWRAMALCGAKTFILTNAAGGIRAGLRPMSLLLIKDHINATGTNPLIGPNIDELGPRFPDLTQLYDPKLRAHLEKKARDLGIELPQGVYVGVHGPSYETPAEIQAFRQIGADVVGMSTVPEAIALCHMGVRVAAISCVTNLAAGTPDAVLDHDDVLENAGAAHDALGKLLTAAITSLGEIDGD